MRDDTQSEKISFKGSEEVIESKEAVVSLHNKAKILAFKDKKFVKNMQD